MHKDPTPEFVSWDWMHCRGGRVKPDLLWMVIGYVKTSSTRPIVGGGGRGGGAGNQDFLEEVEGADPECHILKSVREYLAGSLLKGPTFCRWQDNYFFYIL